MQNDQTYGLIGEPSHYRDTLETWERHLNYLKGLSDTMSNKQELIRRAERSIKAIKENPLPGQMLTPSELQSLQRDDNTTRDFAQKAFAHLRPKISFRPSNLRKALRHRNLPHW